MPYVIAPGSPVQESMWNRNLHERASLSEDDLRQPGCHRTSARTLREAVHECAQAEGADCMLVSIGGRPVCWTWRLPRHPGAFNVFSSLYRDGECLGHECFDEILQPQDIVVLSAPEC